MKKYRWKVDCSTSGPIFLDRVVNKPGHWADGAVNCSEIVSFWPFESIVHALRRAKYRCIMKVRKRNRDKRQEKALTAQIQKAIK